MEKIAIQFGAGNIGRGFIGEVLFEAGYKVIFADVVEEVLKNINERKEYCVHIADEHKRDVVVSGICAYNSNSEEIVEKFVDAEIVTTAVGLRAMKFVAPTIAKGLIARKKAGVENPLNIIACENGLRASTQLKNMVLDCLDEETGQWMKSHVGYPDAAVNRIVPPVRCEKPLDVTTEEFYEWDVERSSFVGKIPEIPGMTLIDDFDLCLELKLFILNTGHAVAAYIGSMRGLSTIDECMADPRVRSIVEDAMHQSGAALMKKFNFSQEEVEEYINKTLKRFINPYLHDDVNRVGRDPLRKLAWNDRLILPMKTAKYFGLPYDKLLLATGAALHFNNPKDRQSVEMLDTIAKLGLPAAVSKFTDIDESNPLNKEIVNAYYSVENYCK
jgi:mannitol-1-phosphate 5-dehydrogenase